MNFTIEDIVAAAGGEAFLTEADKNNTNFNVTGMVIDSRIATEGGVFIATEGERVDGHSFIKQVFDKGAKLVITEKTPEAVEEKFGIPAKEWGSYILVDDSFIALKKLGRAYRKKLSIPIVGITGSVGKTSTKEFIAGVLGQKYNVLKTEGNYNNEIGVPLTLLKIREEHEVAVVEMGISDFGEMTRLSEMAQPDIAVITNIGQCHLENLGTRDGILKAKTEIFTHMNPDGNVCLFGDDDKLITVDKVNGKAPYFFGENTVEADTAEMGNGNAEQHNVDKAVSVISSEDKGLVGSAATLRLNMPNKGINNVTIRVNVPLPGHHMVINAAAAANVAMLLDLTAEEIAAGIENMKPISGRNNIVQLKDILLIDDCYNANPVSMRSSIDLLKLAKGTTVAILGDMFELGADEAKMHAGVGEYAVEAGVDCIYCVGELSKNMYEAARETFEKGGRAENISYWKTRDELLAGIREDFTSGRRELIPYGANILVKASHGMHFEEVVKLFRELYT